MTVKKPSKNRTGAGPIEYISRNMTDVMNVLMPDGRGTVQTLSNDSNVMAHIKPFRWEFKSIEQKFEKQSPKY